MRYLRAFVTPHAGVHGEELKYTLDEEQAREIDRKNQTIYRENRKLVMAARQAIKEVDSSVPGLNEMEPPAVQVEYARIVRELDDKEKEGETAALERMEREDELRAVQAD